LIFLQKYNKLLLSTVFFFFFIINVVAILFYYGVCLDVRFLNILLGSIEQHCRVNTRL
jgi:hypothetical protein